MLVRCYPGSEQGLETVLMTQGLSPPLPPPPRWGARSWAWMPPLRNRAALSRHCAYPADRFGLAAWVGKGPPTQTIREG